MLGIENSGLLGFIPGIQGMEWIILIVVAVVFLFGAKKLPELAKSFGRATGEFQKGKQEVDKEIQGMKDVVNPIGSGIKKIQQPVTATPTPTPIPATAPATGPTETATPQPSEPTHAEAGESETGKLLRVAKELGITTEGKTETELREEIAKAMMR